MASDRLVNTASEVTESKASDRLEHLYLTGVEPNGKHIGDGAYGRVFEVEFCGTLYAAKQIHSVLIEDVQQEGFKRMKAMFIAECLQSSALGHQNLVQVLGVYKPTGRALLPVLVMERMEESLTSLVEKCPNIPMYRKLSILLDISQGLWYLHSHQPPIVHRDLSPNNVLLTAYGVAKISDLGVAKVIKADHKKTKTRQPGTVDFMPPEALQEDSKYGLSLDVFSYGGVILHTVNQEWPTPLHYVATDANNENLSARSEVERRQQHINKMAEHEAPGDLQALVKVCLKNNPNSRPLISDVSSKIKKMKEGAESTRDSDTDTSMRRDQTEQATMSRETQTTTPLQWQTEQVTMQRGTQTTPSLQWQTEHTTMSRETQTTPIVAQLSSQVDIFNKAMEVRWEEVAPLPACGSGDNAVLLDGLIYVGGGSKEKGGKRVGSYCIHVYDPNTRKWQDSINTPCCDFGMTVLKDKLVIAGGARTNDDVLNDISVLNPETKEWKLYGKMPNARYNATAVGYCAMLIIIGGVMPTKGVFKKFSSGFWSVQPTVELLDTTTGHWHTCSSIPSPHIQLRAVIMNDTLYVLGGADSNMKPSPKIFGASLDDIATTHELNWQCLADVPFGYSTPVVMYDKYLLTVGGTQQSDSSLTREVRALNPLNALWKQVTTLPVATCLQAVACVGNKLVVIGGMSKDKKFSDAVWTGVFE